LPKEEQCTYMSFPHSDEPL